MGRHVAGGVGHPVAGAVGQRGHPHHRDGRGPVADGPVVGVHGGQVGHRVELDGLVDADGVPHHAVAGVDARVGEFVQAAAPVGGVTGDQPGGVLGDGGLGRHDGADTGRLAAVAGQGDPGDLVHGVLHQAHAVVPLDPGAAAGLDHPAVGRSVDVAPTVAVGHPGLGGGGRGDLVAHVRGGRPAPGGRHGQPDRHQGDQEEEGADDADPRRGRPLCCVHHVLPPSPRSSGRANYRHTGGPSGVIVTGSRLQSGFPCGPCRRLPTAPGAPRRLPPGSARPGPPAPRA